MYVLGFFLKTVNVIETLHSKRNVARSIEQLIAIVGQRGSEMYPGNNL